MTNQPQEVSIPVSKNPVGVLKRTNQFFIDPRNIDRRQDWNPRFDFGEIDELAASIKSLKERDPSTGGLINDIRVKRQPNGRFELVDGDRRLTAIERLIKAGVEFEIGIPAKLEAKDAEDLELLVRMFTANDGKRFLPLEEAAAYQRMREAGLTIAAICEQVGRKQVHVVATLALLDAAPELQEAVKNGEVNSTLAKKIAVSARGDKVKQKELVADAKAAGKDKVKRRAVVVKVDDARRAKAKKKGRVLKMRALSDDQLSAIGVKMSEQLTDLMTLQGLEPDADLLHYMIDADLDQKIAFTFGVLQALKAAAGLEVDLTLVG